LTLILIGWYFSKIGLLLLLLLIWLQMLLQSFFLRKLYWRRFRRYLWVWILRDLWMRLWRDLRWLLANRLQDRLVYLWKYNLTCRKIVLKFTQQLDSWILLQRHFLFIYFLIDSLYSASCGSLLRSNYWFD